MSLVHIIIRYGGELVEKLFKYVGGAVKGIKVDSEMRYEEFVQLMYSIMKLNIEEFSIKLKYVMHLPEENIILEITDDGDLNFFLTIGNVSQIPLCIITESRNRKGEKSGCGSNQLLWNNYEHGVEPQLDEGGATSPRPGHDCVEPQLDEGGATSPRLGHDFNIRVEDESEMEEGFGNAIPCNEIEACGTDKIMTMSSKPDEDGKGINFESCNINEDLVVAERSTSTNDVEIGQIYLSKRELGMKLSMMAMKKNFELKVKKSCNKRYVVSCVDDNCKWRLRAIQVKGCTFFKITKFVDIHTCSLEILNHDHRQAKCWVVGELIKSKYEGVSRKYKPHDIIQDMRQDYGVNISYNKAWRAREAAYLFVRGSPSDSYNLLERYGEALKIKNPGSVYSLELEDGTYFKYFFITLGPCIRGFANCIRPVVVVDGTFLKGKFRGVLLIAACLDGNNQIYPIGFGIVDRESDSSWTWFFEKLKGTIGEVQDLVIVSDRNSSIIKSVGIVFPDAFHGFCTYHIRMNLVSRYKGGGFIPLFLNMVTTYREAEFNELWSRMCTFRGPAKYLEEAGRERWARAFSPRRRYNVMTTNIVECLNSILRDARELPVAGLIEHIRSMLQRWFYERRVRAAGWTSVLSEKAEEIMKDNHRKSVSMKVEPIDCFQFYVKDDMKDAVVNLNTRECSCQKFDLDQIPCSHAIAAARERNIDPYTLCSQFYKTESVIAAYAEAIYPIGHISE